MFLRLKGVGLHDIDDFRANVCKLSTKELNFTLEDLPKGRGAQKTPHKPFSGAEKDFADMYQQHLKNFDCAKQTRRVLVLKANLPFAGNSHQVPSAIFTITRGT